MERCKTPISLIDLAILISNARSRTNLQAIIDAITDKELEATISVVISDAQNAY